MSVLASISELLTCSGDIYAIVPLVLSLLCSFSWLAILAIPKSTIFTAPSSVIMILLGFISQCTIPLLCAFSSPLAICLTIFRISLRVKSFPLI